MKNDSIRLPFLFIFRSVPFLTMLKSSLDSFRVFFFIFFPICMSAYCVGDLILWGKDRTNNCQIRSIQREYKPCQTNVIILFDYVFMEF